MVGDLGELIKSLTAGVTDFTKDGKCSGCGQCCSDVLPLSKDEIKKIRKYISVNEIEQNVNRPPVLNPVYIDLTCPFRNEKEHKCDIYAVRPAICKSFVCNKPPSEADKYMFAQSRKVISMRQTFFGGKRR